MVSEVQGFGGSVKNIAKLMDQLGYGGIKQQLSEEQDPTNPGKGLTKEAKKALKSADHLLT